jgi:hypothetical protein
MVPPMMAAAVMTISSDPVLCSDQTAVDLAIFL